MREISYVILRQHVRHKFCLNNTHMKCERKMTTLCIESYGKPTRMKRTKRNKTKKTHTQTTQQMKWERQRQGQRQKESERRRCPNARPESYMTVYDTICFFSCLRFPFHFVWIVSIPINQNSKLNDVWFYVHIRIHVHYARISILEFPTHQVLLMDGFYDRPSMTLLSLFK